MKASFLFALLSAASTVVAFPAAPVDDAAGLAVRAATTPAAKAAATKTTTTASATASKKPSRKKTKAKPEVIPQAVKPVPTTPLKSPKWSAKTHPKEQVPKDSKKKTGSK